MGIVATGASVGGIIHPSMLNQLFEGSLGFHNGVRVSAAMNGFLLIIANIISLQPGTGTQKKEKKEGEDNSNSQGKKFWLFFKEPAYATAVAGYVTCPSDFLEKWN